MPVDPVVNAMLNPGRSEEADLAELPDPMAKFRADAQLAAHLGWAGVEKLAEATSDLDEQADRIFRAERRQPCEIQAASSPDSVTDDGRRLAKRHTAATTFRKSQNGRWMLEFDAGGLLIAGREIESN